MLLMPIVIFLLPLAAYFFFLYIAETFFLCYVNSYNILKRWSNIPANVWPY
jgi:hypothetical protein